MGRCDFKPGEKLNSRLETEQKKVRNFSVEFSHCCCTKSDDEQQQSEKAKAFHENSQNRIEIFARKSSGKENVLMENHRVQIHGEAAEREEKKRAKAGMENSRFCAVENARRRAHREGKPRSHVSVDVRHTMENVYVFITCSLLPLSSAGLESVFYYVEQRNFPPCRELFMCFYVTEFWEVLWRKSWAENWVGEALIIQHNTRNHFEASNRLSWWARARLTHDTNSIKATTKKYFYIFSCDRVYMLVCLTSTPKKKKTSTTLTLLSRSIGMVCCCWHIAFLPLTVTQNIYSLSQSSWDVHTDFALYFIERLWFVRFLIVFHCSRVTLRRAIFFIFFISAFLLCSCHIASVSVCFYDCRNLWILVRAFQCERRH